MTRTLSVVWTSLPVLFVTAAFAFGAEPLPDPSRSEVRRSPELEHQLETFLAAKRKQIERVLAHANLPALEQLDGLFAAMADGDCSGASNRYQVFDQQFRNRPTDSRELGLVWQMVMELNPNREYFIEESFPIAWLYPYLEPAGPVLRIHPAPRAILGEEIVRKDREYWQRLCGELIGDWIQEDTRVEQICPSQSGGISEGARCVSPATRVTSRILLPQGLFQAAVVHCVGLPVAR